MIQSAELGELLAALSAFQGEVESVSKDAANPFFKSSYASLPAVVKAASPLLAKHTLTVTQHLGHDEDGDTLTTIVGHASGQYLGDTMRLRPVKDDPQAQGSATTYGRRYAYMAALGLVAEEDDDGNAGSGGSPASRTRRAAPKSKPKQPVIDANRLQSLQVLAHGAGGKKVADVLKDLNCTLGQTLAATLSQLTPEQADKFEQAVTGGLLPANAEPLKGGE